MSLPPFDPAAVRVDGDVTLVLAQRSTRLRGHRLAISTEVADELRTMCGTTLATLGELNPVAYSSELDFDASAQYMLARRTSLVGHAAAGQRGRPLGGESADRPEVEMDAAALQVLRDASSLPQLDSRELKKQSFSFYAAVIGDDPAQRVGFVRAWNPYRAALSGRLLTMFGDRLRRIEGPVLAFDSSFDIVVTADAVAVLRAAAFEKLFWDVDAMKDRIPVWSAAVIDALPLDELCAERLAQLCARNSRVARLARGLYERGVLAAGFTIGLLEEEMRRQGLDTDRLIKDGKLMVEDDDIPSLLKLVDERLYTGWSSKTPWDVGTRSKRPS